MAKHCYFNCHLLHVTVNDPIKLKANIWTTLQLRAGNIILPATVQALHSGEQLQVTWTFHSKYLNAYQHSASLHQIRGQYWKQLTRPPLERRKTLGHLSSINPNMINHYASQSQTCQLLKILKNIFFFQIKKMWKVVQSISGWTDIQNPYRLSRGRIYIYTYICGVLGIAF